MARTAHFKGAAAEMYRQLDFRCQDLTAALQEILNTRPAVTLDINAKVGDPKAAGWNVHRIAAKALAGGDPT